MGRLIVVNHIQNPFDPHGSRQIVQMPAGLTVKECIDRLPIPAEGYDYAVSVDGLLLSQTADLAACRPASSLVVCAVPQGGNGKNPVLMVAMIAVMIVAYVYAPPAGAAMNAALFAGELAAQTATAIAFTAIMVAGNLLINALMPAYGPDATGGGSDFSKSSTYGWDVTGNSDRENVPWPVLWGTHRIYPPIIGKYVEVAGDKQYLNVLYAVADHAIDSIDEASVEINGNAVANGEDGVFWETRLGAVDQPVLQRFNDTRTAKTIGSKLTTSWSTVQTDGNAVEGVGVAFSLPRGLCYGENDGSLGQASVKIDVEMRLLPAGAWVRLEGKNETDLVLVEPRWSGGYCYAGEWYEIEVGSEVPGDHTEGQIFYPVGWNFLGGGSGEDDPRPIPTWHWSPAAETNHGPGLVTTDYKEIAGAQTSPLRRVYYRDRMTAGSYEIRARFHEAPPSGVRYSNDVWFDYLEEIIYDDFTYPGTSLFALRALATDKLSGSLPRVSLIATRSTVPVWTGAAYEDKDATLSAWQAWDALHNEDYGGGVAYGRLPVAPFQAWADYCDTKGYHSNIYFDSLANLRKALDMLSQLGEGAVAQMGSKFTCYVDGEVDLPVQSFMFADANVIRDTYQESYMPSDDRANAVEVTFWDAANGYKRTTFEIPAADFDSTTEEIKRTQLTLIGCTSRAEAIKHGFRALNRNRYLTLTSSWEAGFDAIGCLPWDPVVPPLGVGGRVVSGTAGSVTIDQPVVLEPGHTYIIRIKSSVDDSAEEATVAAVAEETTTDTLTIVGVFTHTPLLHEMFLFYEQGDDVKLARIVSITRKDDNTRKITAIEYSAAACDDTGTVTAPEAEPSRTWVSHLHAEEVWKGGAETRAQLSWMGLAILWRVWYRVPALSSVWMYAGETTRPFIEIRGLDYGQAYEFSVSHTRNPEDGETATLTLAGKITAPGNVDTVTAVPWEDGCTFTWAKVDDFDLAGYQVRTGVHWQASTLYAIDDFYVVPTDGTARRYRCVTPGTSGATEPAWPESGTIADGTVTWLEDSSGWTWQTIAMPAFVRELTGEEKEQQGKDRLTVRIWAVGADAFGNVSATPATASGTVLNQKPYVSVGVTSVEGTFTALPAAIAKLPSGGGRIVIKNGEYQATGPIAIPDLNLEIEGESRSGVVLKNHAGDDLFVLHNLTKAFSFKRFSVASQNVAAFSKMFKIYGESSSLTARVDIDKLTMSLVDAGLGSGKDAGIYHNHGAEGSSLTVNDVIMSGSRHGVYVCDEDAFGDEAGLNLVNAVVLGCQFDLSQISIISKYFSVVDNLLKNIIQEGIKCASMNANGDNNIASRNKVYSRTDSAIASSWTGISASSDKMILSENVVVVGSTISHAEINGIAAVSRYINMNANQIQIVGAFEYGVNGIYLAYASDASVRGSKIDIGNSDHTAYTYGIRLESALRNILTANSINLRNNNAKDIGVLLSAGSNNNQGSDNITYNCGTSISDSGTGNTVTAKDI
ncbi:MAG: phage tail protein [Deltaproteobacteria bacterium]|nr:phage tail protein [Deltaproteobacteria bacterium]